MTKLYSSLCILFCLIAKEYVDAGICDLNNNPFNFTKVLLKVYKGDSSLFTSTESSLTNPQNISKDIDPDKDTVLFIHGFIEDSEAENVQVVPKAYLDRGDVNVLVVDWGELAFNINYFYVSSQTMMLGKAIAEAVLKLADVVDLSTLHIIGHSLGAHVAGQVARSVNGTLKRLTGLDPAFPLFYPSACHIKQTDAAAVVILHTDGGFYGTPIDTGTVDFYANKGVSPQPGCPIIIGGEICSHQRSTRLFAESVTNPRAFPARECLYKLGENDSDNEVVYLNDSTPTNVHGAYCFNTNAKSPYGRQS
ncbi:phospholipase A1 [Lasioglossum baleicum]|uniref:phospholipase A1 n=1 Tax=Lasioglossum baleicum TaxID=434251 RepID=UPI003FCE479C